ncbi:PREDICTED: bcl-2-binding component 3 [Ceratotherium simum simum]|uniref:Bcl-2-binding component 3 n=1 Tax=Ceratotherium simum simum TaxID=73337 RepID=A0ABM1DFH8_CERSS|nr:PREDICTED: bcl-2-binding component 3 [Ceratotherium simum simum]
MARARQEGSSPEPVEGLARDGPRPFPLGRLVPSAGKMDLVSLSTPAPTPPLEPEEGKTESLEMRRGAEKKLGCRKREKQALNDWSLEDTSGPRGVAGADHAPRLFPGPPSLLPAEQHLESPVPSAPGALEGGPTQAAPGVRGEEEQWAREIGAQLRRMADDLNALYERRREEEQQRHRPSPWRVLYNLIMGLLPLPRGPGAPEMEPN